MSTALGDDMSGPPLLGDEDTPDEEVEDDVVLPPASAVPVLLGYGHGHGHCLRLSLVLYWLPSVLRLQRGRPADAGSF
uniref:Uncharacterized protein n=1 Tax=Globodera rostochiensis TaxID=31243 RepID=A0A914HWL0_GLORO